MLDSVRRGRLLLRLPMDLKLPRLWALPIVYDQIRRSNGAAVVNDGFFVVEITARLSDDLL
jgi:hypothetical protein